MTPDRSLRGVQFTCAVEVIESHDTLMAIGRSVRERYNGSASASAEESLARSVNKRIGIGLTVERIASWAHSKLQGSATMSAVHEGS